MQSSSKKQKITTQPMCPICLVASRPAQETEREIREAIGLHIEGMIEDGLPVPQPTSIVQYIEVTA